MKFIGILEGKTAHCPTCGEAKEGLVYCPVEYEATEMMILHTGRKTFLCKQHFIGLLNAGHRVVLDKRKKAERTEESEGWG